MAKQRNATPSAATPSGNQQTATTTSTSSSISATTPTATPSKPKSTHSSAKQQTWDQIVLNLTEYYQSKTPQRTKLIDAFLAFLVVVGVLQFVYCVLAGNYVSSFFASHFLFPENSGLMMWWWWWW